MTRWTGTYCVMVESPPVTGSLITFLNNYMTQQRHSTQWLSHCVVAPPWERTSGLPRPRPWYPIAVALSSRVQRCTI